MKQWLSSPTDRSRVYVGNIDWKITSEDLKAKLDLSKFTNESFAYFRYRQKKGWFCGLISGYAWQCTGAHAVCRRGAKGQETISVKNQGRPFGFWIWLIVSIFVTVCANRLRSSQMGLADPKVLALSTLNHLRTRCTRFTLWLNWWDVAGYDNSCREMKFSFGCFWWTSAPIFSKQNITSCHHVPFLGVNMVCPGCCSSHHQAQWFHAGGANDLCPRGGNLDLFRIESDRFVMLCLLFFCQDRKDESGFKGEKGEGKGLIDP